MSKQALVIGGGFAGLEAAISLAKSGLAVTLVSERPYLWIYPTSIWVATGEYPPERVTLDLAAVGRKHGFEVVVARVESIDPAARAVRAGDRTLSADYLVVALGGGRLRPKGVEHTHTISGDPAATEAFRDALLALVGKGSGRIAVGFGGNPKDPSGVRGGPAFELMFNVDALLRKRGVRDRFELTFFAPMPTPGARMGTKAVAAVKSMFENLGVATRYGKKIAAFDAGGSVVFEDGSRLESYLTMFIPAVDGHPLLKASGLPLNEAGFVTIDDGCEVPGFDGVFVVGDSAALQGPAWRAKQGHLAEVMARVASANVAAIAAGSAKRESYLPHMSLVCLMDTGNGAAYVKRDDTGETLVPLPVVGHWAKKGWGGYYKLSKLKAVPRLPGM
jgi:sulfide:quinone oxidoreductase